MKNQAAKTKKTQSGNVFFWILIMVFLFAALSFALSQGLRGSAASLSSQQAKTGAGAILDYGRTVRDAVKAMRIDGIPTREIDFDTVDAKQQDGGAFNQNNTNCASASCEVYSPQGGKIRAQNFYEYAANPPGSWTNNSVHVGSMVPLVARVVGVGTSAPELLLHMPIVHPTVCKELNKLMGITTWPIIELQTGGLFYYNFIGNVDAMLASNDAMIFGVDVPELAGKTAFCTGNDTFGDIFLLIEAR